SCRRARRAGTAVALVADTTCAAARPATTATTTGTAGVAAAAVRAAAAAVCSSELTDRSLGQDRVDAVAALVGARQAGRAGCAHDDAEVVVDRGGAGDDLAPAATSAVATRLRAAGAAAATDELPQHGERPGTDEGERRVGGDGVHGVDA